MQTLTYHPWIGPNFGKSDLGKLLIIGDSHYFNGDEPKDLVNFTKAQIAELDDISSNFHDTVIQLLGHEKHSDLWKNVAFANGIQSAFTSANQVPTKAEKDTAELAFKGYLDLVRPEKVIVFSSRLWEHFFNKPGWGTHLGKINDRWNIRALDYSGGHCRALGIYHPSAHGFSVPEFRQVIASFLEM